MCQIYEIPSKCSWNIVITRMGRTDTLQPLTPSHPAPTPASTSSFLHQQEQIQPLPAASASHIHLSPTPTAVYSQQQPHPQCAGYISQIKPHHPPIPASLSLTLHHVTTSCLRSSCLSPLATLLSFHLSLCLEVLAASVMLWQTVSTPTSVTSLGI